MDIGASSGPEIASHNTVLVRSTSSDSDSPPLPDRPIGSEEPPHDGMSSSPEVAVKAKVKNVFTGLLQGGAGLPPTQPHRPHEAVGAAFNATVTRRPSPRQPFVRTALEATPENGPISADLMKVPETFLHPLDDGRLTLQSPRSHPDEDHKRPLEGAAPTPHPAHMPAGPVAAAADPGSHPRSSDPFTAKAARYMQRDQIPFESYRGGPVVVSAAEGLPVPSNPHKPERRPSSERWSPRQRGEGLALPHALTPGPLGAAPLRGGGLGIHNPHVLSPTHTGGAAASSPAHSSRAAPAQGGISDRSTGRGSGGGISSPTATTARSTVSGGTATSPTAGSRTAGATDVAVGVNADDPTIIAGGLTGGRAHAKSSNCCSGLTKATKIALALLSGGLIASAVVTGFKPEKINVSLGAGIPASFAGSGALYLLLKKYYA